MECAGEVKRSRARETGTLVILIDRDKEGGDWIGDDYRWWTLCDVHSTCVGHDTRELAQSFMAAPTEWCEDCR